VKIAIFGANGLLGRKLVACLSGKYEILGVLSQKGKIRHNNLTVAIDIRSQEQVERLFNEFSPDVAINCAAICDLKKCEDEKQLAYDVHVKGTENIGRCCKKYDSKIIYISSDYIYDGQSGPYSEETPPCPINYYGVTKLEGEKILEDIQPRYLIIRPTILYGYNDKNDKQTYVMDVLNKLKKKKELYCDNERIKYPVLIDDLARALDLFISIGAEGKFNLATEKGLTRFEWAKIIANVFELDEVNIYPQNTNSYNKDRPCNVMLLTDKLRTTGFVPCGIEEGLKIMKDQMKGEIPLEYNTIG
jgi:dTDP-4-dehydrorhamnose reductase